MPLGSRDEAEQEEQASIRLPERVALEVQEDVPPVGLRKHFEPPSPRRVVAEGDQSERGHGFGHAPGSHLKRGLGDQLLEPFRTHLGHGLGYFGKLRQGLDVGILERPSVGLPDPRHEDQRVLVTPLAVALAGELTEWAVRVRFRPRGQVGAVFFHQTLQLKP